MATVYPTYVPRAVRLIPMVVTCPRCGLPVWQDYLDGPGCPTCKVLDSREPARTDVR
jgi:hypothetical protein